MEQDVKQGARKLLDDAVERAQDGVAKGLNSVAGATGSSSAEESDNGGGLSSSSTVNINGPKVYVRQEARYVVREHKIVRIKICKRLSIMLLKAV